MLDLYVKQKEPVRLQTTQGNYGVPYEFRLMDYTIPAGASIVMAVQKPSNAIATVSGSYSGNIITVSLSLQQTAEAGMCSVQLRVISSGQVVQMFPMVLEVVALGFDPDRELSTDEWEDLNDALALVADAITHTELTSSPLPVELGGTGRNNLNTFFNVYDASEYSDANDMIYAGCYAISAAATIAHLPYTGGANIITLTASPNYNIQIYMSRENNEVMYIRKLIGGTWTAWKDQISWSDLATTPLATQYGGTGAANLNALMRNGISTSSLSNANDAPMMTAFYVSSASIAQSIANLPVQSAGHLVTVGGEIARGYQFYFLSGSVAPRGWVRIKTAEWGTWYDLFRTVPTWTAPGEVNATVVSGGYFQTGKQVTVQLKIEVQTAISANAGATLLSGFPIPLTNNVPVLVSSSLTKQVIGTITKPSSGSTANLTVENLGPQAIAVGGNLYITATYYTA